MNDSDREKETRLEGAVDERGESIRIRRSLESIQKSILDRKFNDLINTITNMIEAISSMQ